MSKPRVYVETTIPSFCHEVRTAPQIVARRDWTRQWWATAADNYELVTSPAVIDELSAGPPDRSSQWLTLVVQLPLHLALASFHKCDFLVTWNCEHLANANKFGHVHNARPVCSLACHSLRTTRRHAMTSTSNDAPIDEIRELRRQISARFDHDPAQLVAYCLKLQEQYSDRLLQAPKKGEQKDQTAA